MSTQIGTASDYVDLLQKLDLFLCTTGHAWGKQYTGTGTGDLTAYLGTASSVAETFTLTAINATTFSVVGSVSGALANATVGTPYTSAKIDFTITAGGTAFVAGDVFLISTSPPWARLRRRGWADSRSVTTDLLTPDNLYDGSVSTLATAGATTTYIEWKMGAPTRVRRIQAQAPSSTSTRMPKDFVLKWRDDPGDAWTTAGTFNKASWALSEGATFVTGSDPGEHLYWRLDMTNAVTSTAIASLTLHEETVAGSLGDEPLTAFRCAWEAPGLGGDKEIIVNCRTDWSQSGDIWNLHFGMSRTWITDGSELSVMPGWSGNAWRSMLLGTTPIGYWFVVNGQRVIVVTAFQGLMQIAYAGFGFPYEPPSVHPYPAIVGATTGANVRFSTTGASPRFPIDPGGIDTASGHSMAAYFPDSAWRPFQNRYPSSTSSEDGQTAPDGSTSSPGHVWPTKFSNSSQLMSYFVANIDGSRALIPCVLYTPGATGIAPHIWGEFDGLFWTTGFGAAPQAVIRYENADHLLVNNVYRTGTQHFGAVRLD